ncbi:MAG: hypothetical protein ACYC2Y_09945 [Armatimonadota bacterium]
MPWEGWPFERVTLVFLGLAYLIITTQIALLHLGGAFHRWQMWVPVFYGPVLAVVALGASIKMGREIAVASMIFFTVGVLVGLIGTYFHWNAIRRYVTGYSLRNFIVGPPPLLPPTFAALSAFGALAVYWAWWVR